MWYFFGRRAATGLQLGSSQFVEGRKSFVMETIPFEAQVVMFLIEDNGHERIESFR